MLSQCCEGAAKEPPDKHRQRLNHTLLDDPMFPDFSRKCLLAIALSAVFPVLAEAAEPQPQSLKEVAQQAVLNSPEVTSKWHNLKAAEEEIGVARGGYFPRVDLTTGGGRESLKQPPLNAREDYTRRGYVVSLNQMIFDGFATRNEVRRLDKARLVRYYELLDASETVALEAARAYLDVLRYRSLVALAEDNYVQHKATHEQLIRRTQSGVGRRVDLEQAGSRLALAEVNLTTETANLHDVTARYQRLVNAAPPGTVTPPAQVGTAYPARSQEALATLYRKNPALLAAIENTEAAQYDINVRRAAYSPKLDFRARTDNTTNYLGIDGEREYNVAEVVVTWNLFNGGSDRAREKQYIERKNVALDLREKACRDTRQTLLIAHNDVQRLREQNGYLATQVALLEKTLLAYRDQYNVGQRTLLDLLDTENELLSARRNAVNAQADLNLAYLRTYAGMGTLLEVLGLQKLDSRDPEAGEKADVDAAQLCPGDNLAVGGSDRSALDARARALVDAGRPAPVALPVAPLVMPVAPPAPVSPAAPAGAADDITRQVKAWAAAWAAKDYATYSAFYARSFVPWGGVTQEEWAQLRRSRIQTRERIGIDIQDLQVQMAGSERARVVFRQTYQSDAYSDTVQKTLEMVRVDGRWLIEREISVPCAGNTVGGCKPK